MKSKTTKFSGWKTLQTITIVTASSGIKEKRRAKDKKERERNKETKNGGFEVGHFLDLPLLNM